LFARTKHAMLLSLKIHNYALIDELYVEFHKGLNIITGETGAGKSILLGALGLILGKRADTSILSQEDKKCIIEAEFNVTGYNLKQVFDENDIDYDSHVIIRREILISGKSRAFINDTPVTLSILQEIALMLVDIHAQHQHLLLNQHSYILNIIDSFTGLQGALDDYQKIYWAFKDLEKKYNDKLNEFNRIKEESDFISHQVTELEDAKLSPGEIEQLEQEIFKQEHAGELKSIFHDTSGALNAEDRGVMDMMASIGAKISKIGHSFPGAQELSERIQSVSIEIKDIADVIKKLFESFDFDPGHYEQIKSRLDLLNGLLLKYRANDVSELIEIYHAQREKLSIATDGEFDLEKTRKELSLLAEKADKLADELSERREGCFATLQSQIIDLLKDLAMEHSQVAFVNQKQGLSIHGKDNIKFLFSANKNHPVQDISKIASGGELSRLMLSVKALLAGTNGMPTLILDEIDTGVSGEIADKVGNIIKNMSNSVQIINITHLPQVASKGETHFLVYKDHDQSITRTLIKQLTDNERLLEIAKMLSGEQITDAALDNARELLKN
jgi:DNA repair protein RecN (Recombination protein N)